MESLDRAPAFDGNDLDLAAAADGTEVVSWRSAVAIWIVLSVAGWAGAIALLLAFL